MDRRGLSDRDLFVLDFLEGVLRRRGKGAPTALDENLVRAGKLDSLVITELILFLEREFGFELARVQLLPSTFDSVRKILALAERQAS